MVVLRRLQAGDEKERTSVERLLSALSLSGDTKECPEALFATLLASEGSELWGAFEGEVMIGMATLALVVKTTGITAHVEDVVVSPQARGKGVGQSLMEKLIERARARGATMIVLTSRPSREAAHALYLKIGFEKYDTQVFRLRL
jgi:ribosomal protein S18 acetylase RimI-like enzyme